MSLPLAVAVIVLADVALIALLTFVMSRARLLTPQVASPVAPVGAPARPETRVRAGRRARARDRISSGDGQALPVRA